jgi:hypothetical protein
MPEDPPTLLHPIIRSVERALRHAENALEAMWWLQHGHFGDRCVAAQVVQREQWLDLRDDVQRIVQLLDDVSCDLDDLGTALNEPRYVHRHPDDEPVADDELLSSTSIESSTAMPLEASWSWQREQRRGNGAAPSAASIKSGEARQLSHSETGDQ